jgi:hypothetical protein
MRVRIDLDDDAHCHPITYKAHSGLLKWLCIAPLVGSIGLVAALDAVDITGADKILIAIGLFGSLAAVFIWIYSAWAAIPVEHRVTDSGKVIHPIEAVVLLCVPIFNLYWMIVSSRAICDALDRMLSTTSSSRVAPRNLALAASICQLIPATSVVVAPLLWLWFMFRFDAAARELERALVSSADVS